MNFLWLWRAKACVRTSVDIVLRNLIRNTATTDSRRRIAVPLFTGRRLPSAVGAVASVALDITALLVLGWLGLLSTVLENFPNVVLPAGVMAELFEGRRRIRRGQRTRLRKAIEIRDAIAKGQLKVLRTPRFSNDTLSTEVGVELSALIREAQATSGVVIRPAPVMRIGLSQPSEVDLAAYDGQLCDMRSLLKVLVELNAIDEETEASAKRYFTVQDKGWAASAVPKPSQPIFLDGLSLVYLQHTGLLHTFLRAFPEVHIHVSTEEELNSLIDDDRNVAEVFRIIDDIRAAVRQANAAGRVTLGARRTDISDSDVEGIQSTINLLANLSDVELVVIDDRALNKEFFAADAAGRRVRLVSTLDLIEELHGRGLLADDRYRALRYRLRTGGALLMPVTETELTVAVKRNRQNEAPEFRAIRDSLDLARLSETPQFPAEMRWFMSYVQAIRISLMRVWNDELDNKRADTLASAIFDMRIVADDWLDRWGENAPPNWVEAVNCTLIGGLAVPIELADEEKLRAYQKWLDDVAMSGIRSRSPSLYQKVVDYLRSFTLMSWGSEEEDE